LPRGPRRPRLHRVDALMGQLAVGGHERTSK
jgi:hypothetical protein